MDAKEIAEALSGKPYKEGRKVPCPAHNDKNPSLSIKDGDHGNILLKCWTGCKYGDIVRALKDRGLWSSNGNGAGKLRRSRLPKGIFSKIKDKYYVKHWTYWDSKGEIIGYVVRYEDKDGKITLPFFNKNKLGEWKSKGPSIPSPLYNLDKLSKASKNTEVWIFEGEKCADKGAELGLLSTTSQGGANAPAKADWRALEGFKTVIIWPDNDEPGQSYAAIIKRELETLKQAPKIKIVDVSKLNLEEKGDIVDWTDSVKDLKDSKVELSKLEFIEELDSIIVEGGKLPKIVDNMERALLKNLPHSIFQRSGQIVKISKIDQITTSRFEYIEGEDVFNESVSAIRRKQGTIIIWPVNEANLTELFAKTANFIKLDSKGGNYPADPPTRAVSIYAGRVGSWKLPILTRIIECPTLRHDGSILDKPGYDEMTGLYFEPGQTRFLEVPENPSKDEAIEALEGIKRHLKDFPFVDNASRSVALAAILTGLVRQSLRSAPLFAFTAPTMGSGKSLLADIVAIIATGRNAPAMSQAKDSEEDKKRLLSLLLTGDPIILIDNVEKPISGDALCSILTQETYQDRLLGLNRMIMVDTHVTFMATGNNLHFKGDITTRALLCSIDPKMERPEERKFKGDLRQIVTRQRSFIVQNALTVLRAYHIAGRPSQDIKPYGRFEQWSDFVRSALVWLGEEDPCRTRYKIDADDPVQAQLGSLLKAWWDNYKGSSVSLNKVIEDIEEVDGEEEKVTPLVILHDSIAEIAGGDNGKINSRTLGWYIRKYEGRVANGLRFCRDEGFSTKIRLKWLVEKV